MTDASDSRMTEPDPSRERLSHLRLHHDSPALQLSDGVHAWIAMTRQTMISKVVMMAGSSQDECSHQGETVIFVVGGWLAISIGGEQSTVAGDEIAIIPADERYSLIAGSDGCTRIDVFTPPNFSLAEEAFHQEHANHGFE